MNTKISILYMMTQLIRCSRNFTRKITWTISFDRIQWRCHIRLEKWIASTQMKTNKDKNKNEAGLFLKITRTWACFIWIYMWQTSVVVCFIFGKWNLNWLNIRNWSHIRAHRSYDSGSSIWTIIWWCNNTSILKK